MTVVTIGMGLADKKNQIGVLEPHGQNVRDGSVNNAAAALRKDFRRYADAVVVSPTAPSPTPAPDASQWPPHFQRPQRRSIIARMPARGSEALAR